MKLMTSAWYVAGMMATAILICGVQADGGDYYFLKLREKTDKVFERVKSTKFASALDRRQAIVQSLKTFTASSQKNILSTLEKSRAHQSAQFSYEPLWLINEILIQSPDDNLIATLAKMADVASITKDHVYYVQPSLGHEWTDPNESTATIAAADCTDPPPALECTNCTQKCDPIDLWGRNYINIAAAHAQNATGKGARVGIIDTGCFRNHDQYGDRLSDDIWLDATDNNGACPYDDNGHGTHCSGIAVGRDTGVAIEANLFCCKNMNASGYTALSRDIRCFQFMVEQNVGVAGNSYYTDFVPGEALQTLKTAVDNAVTAGLVVVVSSGNDGCPGSSAPGNFSSVIGVGSIDVFNKLSSFSSCLGKTEPVADLECTNVDAQDDKPSICAPGHYICSSWPNATYPYKTISGTSMAGPFVTGVVGLLLGVNPELTPEDVKYILCKSAQKVELEPTCSAKTFLAMLGQNKADFDQKADLRNQCCGWGGLDAAQAVEIARNFSMQF